MKIRGKGDKLDTYNEFSDYISIFIQRKRTKYHY